MGRKKIWSVLIASIVILAMLTLLAPSTQIVEADSTPSPFVCVIGNSTLLDALELSLDTYSEDLAREGLGTKILAFDDGNYTQLKDLLKNEFSRGLVGSILIGDLPPAIFEDTQFHNETYPCDLYFEDMDGTWIDADGNGKFENHTNGPNGDRSPEIWIGRLKTPVPYVPDGVVLDEITLLKEYFNRNHAYRTGNLSLPNRALLYIEDDWYSWHSELESEVSEAINQTVVVYDQATTNPEDYLQRLTEGWKLIELIAHGGGESHSFFNNGTYLGSVNRLDIREVRPQSFFYTLCSCYCTDWDFFSDYIAGSYVFYSDYSLALLGITDGGLLWNITDYYRSLRTDSLGNSVIKCFENWIAQEDAGSWLTNIYYYGATIIGDPTLRLNITEVPLLRPPEAMFSYSPLDPKVNQSILFNASASNGTILNYTWDFGDGDRISVAQPLINHTYTRAGDYEVILNVTDSNSLWNTTSFTVNVTIVNHDIAITGISPYRTIVCNKTMTTINITVTNEGNVQETFTLVASYNSTAFASQMITVGNGSIVKWLVIWNTTNVGLGNCNVTVAVDQLPGEADIEDNSLSCSIQIAIPGDIGGDGRVDMRDISKVAAGFQTHPGDTKWVANGDLDENGILDMKDISTITKHFGEQYP